jgi:hypothetical protein
MYAIHNIHSHLCLRRPIPLDLRDSKAAGVINVTIVLHVHALNQSTDEKITGYGCQISRTFEYRNCRGPISQNKEKMTNSGGDVGDGDEGVHHPNEPSSVEQRAFYP